MALIAWSYPGPTAPGLCSRQLSRKSTRPDQTLAAIEACRCHGVIPGLSFMLAPPQDPEGETEKTLDSIHLIKRRYPETEIMIYIYTPLPPPRGSPKLTAARAVTE